MLESLAPRTDFPPLNDVTYLDTPSDGLVARPVEEEILAFRAAATPGARGGGEARAAAYERARDAAARLLGTTRERIAITHSATEAAAQVAWGLRPTAPANVVCVDLDFPTVTYPWLRLAGETGLEVRWVRVLDDPSRLTVDAVSELVDSNTGLISVSHVQYAHGHLLDLAQLSALAHAYGALLLVDAAQSLGAVPVDVEAAGVDVLVGHAGKWLCAENGSGICYLRPELVQRVEPPIVGWRSTVEPWDLDGRTFELADEARRLEYSSTSYASRLALAAAIDYLLGFGIEAIHAHVLLLGDLLIDGLEAIGADVATPREHDRRGGIVSASLPGSRAEDLVRELRAAGIAASARLGLVRFGVHLYNDESDVRHAVTALERAAAAKR